MMKNARGCFFPLLLSQKGDCDMPTFPQGEGGFLLMKIKSLGLQTDLMIYRHSSVVKDRGDYLVVSTPQNPHYFWGNLLIFPSPPQEGHGERWCHLFKKEFARAREVRHMTFIWDPTGEKEDLEEFLSRGFLLEESRVLQSSQLIRPEPFREELEILPLKTADQWEEVTELQILVGASRYGEENYRPFMQKRMEGYRKMARKGLGNWYGAYWDGVLVGDLGLFCEGGLGRFQNVETHPNHRCRGICHSLVYWVSQKALQEKLAKKLVLEADPDHVALDIYQNLGYTPVETLRGLFFYHREKVS